MTSECCKELYELLEKSEWFFRWNRLFYQLFYFKMGNASDGTRDV